MGPDVAKKKGNPSKNYSPPIPPTRIPCLLIYYRIFVVFRFFSSTVFALLWALYALVCCSSCFLCFRSPCYPWKIHGKSMDKSRVFGNPDFGDKSRFENKLAVFRKVLKVCGLLFQCCGINFSTRFQAW